MVYLSIEDKTRDFFLFINSLGGWVIPGIGLYDNMQFVPPIIFFISFSIFLNCTLMI
ncbi:ATP-dependent Clp protease proteolytic subunit [Acorus gramineus]|uniref:ATP-dependent Clp protease proteolytic subunit n=1 Tax=Acorus gramineus TaxID=55184 RepID=A0AAV9A320_ACOGR|nr:ATP-dependent Clp protease proteolytic subunit [Acorus gramineus]KAK1258552.1 ATP-dependent Clp protease proteolytic subunit [Acorus gramineus]